MTLLDQLKPHLSAGDRFRKQAWEKLEKIGLPTKKWDAFRYLSLQGLYQSLYALDEGNVELPDSGNVVLLSLEEAMRSYRPLLDKSFHEGIQEEKNPFALMNRAFHRGGRFLYVPPGTSADFQWNFLALEEGKLYLPKFEIYVGKGADVRFDIRCGGEGSYFYNGQIQLTIDDGARAMVKLHTSHASEAYGMHTLRARVKRDATLKTFTNAMGGKGERHDIGVDLLGENGEADVRGLSLAKRKDEIHHFIQMKHHEPYCRSNQLYKTVLMGRARSSFEGKIFIKAKAQKTEAYQLNNNLLLSPKAQAMTKPNLEIFADDVQASHGATCSQPKQEELFYLRTRGLSEREAKWHLARGFCHELMQGEVVDNFLQGEEDELF